MLKLTPQSFKLRCDERFTHAFTVCGCVFKEMTLNGSNQGKLRLLKHDLYTEYQSFPSVIKRLFKSMKKSYEYKKTIF